MSLTNSRTFWADLKQREVWGWELMTSRSMSQPSALSEFLLPESWCLHIQGTGPDPGESSINEDCCSEDAHTLSSVRLPLQLLQVPWRLVHLSLLSLTDLISFHLLGCYLPSLSPALCCPCGCSNLTTLSCQSINFENFLTFKSWLYFPVSHPQPSFQNSHTI